MRHYTRHRSALHSVTLGQLITSYLYWAETSLRQSTAESYKASLTVFRQHLGEDTPVEDIGEIAVQRFLKARQDAGKSPNTVRSDHRRLAAFFGWAEERDHISRNWAKLAKPPREERRMMRSTTEEEFARLLEFAGHQETKYRTRAILWLLHDTGMRLGECNLLRLSDVELDQRFVRIRAEDTKDAEGRLAPFTTPCRSAIHDYLTFERGNVVTPLGAPETRLWLSARAAAPLSVSTLKHEFQKVSARAGISFGAHDLRRAFVARALAAGMAESLIMEITGHRSREMLARYGKPRAQENAMASYHELFG